MELRVRRAVGQNVDQATWHAPGAYAKSLMDYPAGAWLLVKIEGNGNTNCSQLDFQAGLRASYE